MTVLKIGGGLAAAIGEQSLRRLCHDIGELAQRHPLVIIPGGGEFADLVRDHDLRFHLSAECSHRLALAAMDQFGLVLGELIPGARTCARPRDAGTQAQHGRAVILAPIAATPGLGALPACWDVTSDSVAVWCAGAARAGRVVLLKAVDGMYREWPPEVSTLDVLTSGRLAELQQAGRCLGVDRYLPIALRLAGVDAWMIAGKTSARLRELLEQGTTEGTHLIA
jgi:aspartokinase-like uncharacterized kinase